MTDLEILNSIKEKQYFTNSLLLERDIFDENQVCKFENQSTNEVFCFFKKTKYDYENMFFYANHSSLSNKNLIEWKKTQFVTEFLTLEKNTDTISIVDQWLKAQGSYHYRTVFRMYYIKPTHQNYVFDSRVQQPLEDDFKEILFLLEQNFDKYSERIPTLEKLKEWKNSTFIIKENNEIAAVLVTETKGKSNEQHFWLVVEKFRGKGYGELIFTHCLNYNPNITRYMSWLDVRNKYSIKKHAEFGFKKDRIYNHIYLNSKIMKDEIIKILEEARPEFNFNDENIDFISAGYLDSFDLITLVVDLETKFDVKILGALILPENFSSVAAILKLIETSKNAS